MKVTTQKNHGLVFGLLVIVIVILSTLAIGGKLRDRDKAERKHHQQKQEQLQQPEVRK